MVIYEVNLTVNNEIFNDYYDWLVDHMKDMLQFRGFQKAEISKERNTEDNSSTSKLIVHYTIASEADLDDYLHHHASLMRADSIKRFGDKFSATRRVFSRTFSIESRQ